MANGNILPETNPTAQRYRSLLGTLGRNTLHALFPKDFEAYFISLELTNSKGDTIDFLTFPITPDQISESKEEITNIKKTAGGITSISSETFVPRQISISGNFGRRLKFVIGQQEVDSTGILFSTSSGVFSKLSALSGNGLSINFNLFSIQAKTGYGLIKLVEAIIDKANAIDSDGKSNRLFLYNPILGNNYLVKPRRISHSQSIDQNMIPRYQLEFTAVAPMEYVRDRNFKNLIKALSFDTLNKAANLTAKTITDVLLQ